MKAGSPAPALRTRHQGPLRAARGEGSLASPGALGVPSSAPSTLAPPPSARASRRAPDDPPWVRAMLVTLALAFVGLFVVLPTVTVFSEALKKGWQVYVAALREAEALAAVRLTLLTAAVAVPLNTGFGLAAAWSITRFRYRAKSVLISLIDLPFGVSPVISGMATVLLFGAHGWFGPWLQAHDLKIVFAVPGIVLATVFVTFPFVARELIPFMEAQGTEEEEAAHVLGASGWQIFFRVTIPNVKWSLLYGVILCNARAMGEFGAVSVVSGHIRGETNTIPLHVEILYNEYNFAASFAVASLLVLLAGVTLVVKKLVEWKERADRAAAGSPS